jgi:diguanylate cyclase (GGDEF)-like protein
MAWHSRMRVNFSSGTGARWLRAFAQVSTLLCAMMIALVWVGVGFHLQVEHSDAERAAVQNSANLARAFEEHLSRTLNEIDRSLRSIRSNYLLDPEGFDLRRWLEISRLFDGNTLQVAIISPEGFIKLSNINSSTAVGTDLRDREHFRRFVNDDSDDLFVSKPVIGRTTGKWSVQLARRITNPDGSFGGVVDASLDPSYLSRFYGSVDVGSEGYVRIVGFDGVVRAVGGRSTEALGKDLTTAALFANFAKQAAGWFYTESGFTDHVPRLVTYRSMKDYPLIVTIGLSTSELFSGVYAKQRWYNLIAVALTLVILGLNAISVRGRFLRDRMAQTLKVQNLRFNALLADMPLGVCMFDKAGQLAISNNRYLQMYRLEPDKITPGTPLRELIERKKARGTFFGDVAAFCQELAGQINRGLQVRGITQLDDSRVISSLSQPTEDGGWVSIHEDITERKKAEEEIAYMAHHDVLTGLLNRARFVERLEDQLASIKGGTKLAVLFLDLDHFKHVNDTLGHLVGDDLLKMVADRLRHCVRGTDVIARLGGDEFAILCADIADLESVSGLADTICAVVKEPYDLNGLQAVVDVSIGIACTSDDTIGSTELMKQADVALYRVKADGRSAYRFFEPKMLARIEARRILEADLARGLAKGQFELFYQPVVNIEENRIVGLEALARWRHPERGLVSPAEFIPIAEETGLIVPLGEWVIRQACSDAAKWPSHIKIAVNLSPTQFRSRALSQVVINALRVSGVAPSRLELEITEEILLGHSRETLTVLEQLRKLGIQIVMDDFGIGYSSLNYLRLFPFDKIKIDRSFVNDLSKGNALSLTIVQAVTRLARVLNVPSTAEGIETEEQLELVRAAGCTEFQGYFFSKPRPAAEIMQLLQPEARMAVSAA